MTINVLVVEDEIEFRNYLIQALPWNDYDMRIVGAAADVSSALAVMKHQDVHLVLLDLTLQRSDGLDLARRLRSVASPAGVIAVTGHSEFQIVRGALRSGVDDYLLKPFAKQELIASILAIRDKLLERQEEERIRGFLRQSMVDGWLHQLTRAETDTEVSFLMEQLSRHDVEIPEPPRVLLCCSPNIGHSSRRILRGATANTAAVWKAAVESMEGSVWTGFDDLIYVLIGGAEHSELEWDVLDMAKDFLITISRHLPYSFTIGISSVENSEGNLRSSWREASRACAEADSEDPVRVWNPRMGLISKTPKDQEPSGAVRDSAVSAALQYWYRIADRFIDRFHHDYSLDVQTVASHLGISSEYLRRVYRECAGITCIQAIAHRRMTHARALLESETAGISEIAARSGFRDASYFARKFKQAHGVTPGSYRRQQLQ